VTSTSGSGKTTLLKLLHLVISEERPNARVFVVPRWPKMALQDLHFEDRWPKVVPDWDGHKNDDFYLIDEGHTTYWDEDLWQSLKDDFQSKTNIDTRYAVLFCSYSQDLREVYSIAPPSVEAAKLTLARVTTPPSGAKDMRPVGLLLDWDEYLGVLTRFSDKDLPLDEELKKFIFDFTGGHVGAVNAMFKWLVKTVRCLIPYHTLLLTFFQGGSRHGRRENHHFRRISEQGPYVSRLNSIPNQ